MKIKLTDNAIGKLKIPAGKSSLTVTDTETKGLQLRLLPSGTKTFSVQFKVFGKSRKIKIGTTEEFSCHQARLVADDKRTQAAKSKLGYAVDPALERDNKKKEAKQPKAPDPKTVGALVPDYLDTQKASLRPSSYAEKKHHLLTQWKPLHPMAIGDVRRGHVSAQFNALTKQTRDKNGRKHGGTIAANRARASLSGFFEWVIKLDYRDDNPVQRSVKAKENGERKRVLTDAEAAKVWLAAPDNDFGKIVRLILLTGCREAEIGDLHWQEIDFDKGAISLPASRVKNHNAHMIPLSAPALAILKNIPRREGRDFVFGTGKGGYSGWSKSQAKIREAVKLAEHWTVHDLRRTVGTGLNALGFSTDVKEAVLNHLPTKLERTYNRHDYATEKRAALDTWATHLMVAIAGGNVTKLPVRKAG